MAKETADSRKAANSGGRRMTGKTLGLFGMRNAKKEACVTIPEGGEVLTDGLNSG